MMEIGNVINVLNQPKAQTLSIMDLGKQLLECAKEGQTSKVHDLMCRGAPFTTDWLGKSALHMAAENNHYETCEVLLRAGISKDSRTKVERTALHLAVCNGHTQIVRLLLEHKCDVNAKDMIKHTPLHWAVEEDYPNLVKLLLRYGADPHAESKAGETPLSLARQRKFDDMCHVMTTYKYQPCVKEYMQEQQEATESLMQEMEKDSLGSFKHSDVDISQDSMSCDNDSSTATIHGNLSSSTSHQQNSSTLQLLQDELSVDDTNNFLQSAYACGRQIVVTELGKQMLKVQNTNPNANSITKPTNIATASNSMAGKNGDIKQKPVGILVANSTATNTTPKVLPKPNIVKRITAEEWTKLCGGGKFKTVSSPNVLTTANGAIRFQKCRLMQKVNVTNDSSNVPTAAATTVKVIQKPTLSNNSMGSAVVTTTPPKKMLIKSEPPQLTNFIPANLHKPNIGSNVQMQIDSETKMVQIPLPDYAKLITQMKELKERVTTLEEHCEKCTGFIRSKSTSDFQ